MVMAKQKRTEDPVMPVIRELFKASKMTLHDFGIKMGYEAEIARQSAFQFLKTADPHVSMLRKAASALGADLRNLIE
jgi:transcriptional regulator with XRE-family HTH domain